MKKTILEIYAFAVCFFAVACVVVTFGLVAWDFVQLSAPHFTINSVQYQCHQSDGAYQNCFANDAKYTRDENQIAFPSGAQLRTKRIADYAQIIHAEKRRALQGIAQKAIVLLLNLCVFLIHWRLAKRAGMAGGSRQPADSVAARD